VPKESTERGERIQVIVSQDVSAALANMAIVNNRTLSNFCSGILSEFLELHNIQAFCPHREALRLSVQHDLMEVVCIDCTLKMKLTREQAKQSGMTIHERKHKEKSVG
jgi:hypothetical protein